MTLLAPNGLGKTLLDNSGPCNVVLRLFRMFSLGQRVQPATMIEFKEIEYFDHTGLLWVLRFRNLCEKRGDVCSEISFWPVCH